MSVLTFGEIMMRISPPGHLRLMQALPGSVEVIFAGGEANVAASLAMFGQPVRYLTAVPKNPITDCLVADLRRLGIDTSKMVILPKGRLGIFFLETGANQRSSNVVYDRDGSTISLARPEDYSFDAALEGIRWVHTTGITPALSQNAFDSCLELVRKARAKGITVSCDLNFRKKLWRWKPGVGPNELAKEAMSQILPYVDVIIANEEDAKDVLGIEAEGTSIEAGKINAPAYTQVAAAIVTRFPSVRYVAITLRESLSADYNNWGGMLYAAGERKSYFAPTNAQGQYEPYAIRDIVDRVGGGDSFGAGLIYAMLSSEFKDPGSAVRFAAAASCLKHSIRGDFNYVSKDEVVALMKGSGSGRVRR